MNLCFYKFFKREWRHFFSSKRYWLTVLIFVILTLLIVGSGAIKYHQMEAEIREFKQIEGKKYDSMQNYKLLSGFGLLYLFTPTSFYSIHNNENQNFLGYLDMVDCLSFYKSTKGRNYFSLTDSYDFLISSYFLVLSWCCFMDTIAFKIWRDSGSSVLFWALKNPFFICLLP